MLGWNHLLKGLFGFIGVTAFLTIVANEVEAQAHDLAESRKRVAAKAKVERAVEAQTPVRKAA